METEQFSTELPLSKKGNEKRNERLPKIQWKWIHNIPKPMGQNLSSAKRKVHITKCLQKEFEEISY